MARGKNKTGMTENERLPAEVLKFRQSARVIAAPQSTPPCHKIFLRRNEFDREEVFHDRGRIAADSGDRCKTGSVTSVRADHCPGDASNRAEHPRAVVHRRDHPSHERPADDASRKPHGLRARRSIRQHIPDVLTDGSDRQDDTPDAAAHQQHCSHRRKGTKPRNKAEAQSK